MDKVEAFLYTLLALAIAFLVFLLLASLYVAGAAHQDQRTCESLGGVYVSHTCFHKEAILDYGDNADA